MNTTPRKLKVGDKVHTIEYDNYKFTEVERVTATQAILKNGTRLKNEPVNTSFSWESDKYSYCVIGGYDRYAKYSLTTDADIEAHKKKMYEKQAITWFKTRDFDKHEIIKVYELFNKAE